MAGIKVGISVTPCRDCLKYNKAIEIMETFKWENVSMGYNKEEKVILLAQEDLMRIIQLVNPVQDVRPIRLISRAELYGNQP